MCFFHHLYKKTLKVGERSPDFVALVERTGGVHSCFLQLFLCTPMMKVLEGSKMQHKSGLVALVERNLEIGRRREHDSRSKFLWKIREKTMTPFKFSLSISSSPLQMSSLLRRSISPPALFPVELFSARSL
jgi:hypothetical protein